MDEQLLNERILAFREFNAGLNRKFPVIRIRGSRNDRPLNVAFYVMGVTDKLYRTSVGENLDYDEFFENSPVKDRPEIGDLILLNDSPAERLCHAHHHSKVPKLLIAHAAVCVRNYGKEPMYFGTLWGKPDDYDTFPFSCLTRLCTEGLPEHRRQLLIYGASLFESEEAKKTLNRLILTRDTTYRGD